MDKEREIQSVRMGNQSIEARPGYCLNLIGCSERAYGKVCEYDVYGNKTKELWLGPGAFIVWKDESK